MSMSTLMGNAKTRQADGADTSITQKLEVLTLPLPPRLPQPPPPVVGDYALVAQLARGGMSGVYLGQHLRTGARVAIKLLADQWVGHGGVVARLLEEHRLAQRIAHAGVVRVDLAARTDDGVPYLVMELVDGENLGGLLERGPLEVGAVAAIGAQVADAMAAVHAAGLVHCDVKPDNLMLLYREGLAGWPAVKVVDFGVTRAVGTVIDEIAGTPGYMPPEQWSGHAEPRTDVYALGCTLYELLTGAPPFEGTLHQVRSAHCDRLPVPPSGRRPIPEALDRLIMRMLAKDLRLRPRMDEVARTLADLAFATPPGALPADLLEPVRAIA